MSIKSTGIEFYLVVPRGKMFGCILTVHKCRHLSVQLDLLIDVPMISFISNSKVMVLRLKNEVKQWEL